MAHNEFKKLSLEKLKSLFKESKDNEKILVDVKGLHSVKELKKSKMKYWRL